MKLKPRGLLHNFQYGVRNFKVNEYLGPLGSTTWTKIQCFGSTNLKKGRIVEFGAAGLQNKDSIFGAPNTLDIIQGSVKK